LRRDHAAPQACAPGNTKRFIPSCPYLIGENKMFCRSEHRTIVKQSLSLLVALAIWSNFVCLTTYGRALTRYPLKAGRVKSSVTTKTSGGTGVHPSEVATTKESIGHQRVELNKTYGKLPLRFEINKGQTDSQVQFLARGSGYNIFLTPAESVMVLSRPSSARSARRNVPVEHSSLKSSGAGSVVRTRLTGARVNPEVSGLEELPGKSNYLIGNDPSRWRVGVSSFARVKYSDVYPGIDLFYYGNQGQLEYDYVVAPGADPRAIKLHYDGVRRIRIDRNGDLLLSVKGGELRQSKPIAYQLIEGERREVASSYQTVGKNLVEFAVGTYDANKPLVIDPVLLYSTYLGGSASDSGSGIAVDSAGNAFIIGATASPNFPTASPLDATLGGTSDVFVMKLAPDGHSLIYSTYIGGSGSDGGADIAIDSSGNAFITGSASSGFPTVAPFQSRIGGNTDAFIAKLNPAGSALVYSSFLGGKLNDSGSGIAIDASGSAYVTGTTSSTNFPVLNAIQGSNAGSDDAFVTKVNATGTALGYSTYLGGTSGETGYDIAVDSLGNAHVTGTTFSPNFPTANAFQPARAGGWEAFVTKLNASGTGFVYSTYVGGSIIADIYDFGEGGRAITVDAAGNAYVTGEADTVNFPTVNAGQSYYGGGFTDGWVGKFNPSGSAIFLSYLGGGGADDGNGIALDSSGNIFITGNSATGSGGGGFPTVNAIQSSNAGSNDGFVTKMSPDGLTLLYSTYIGGTDSDLARGIAVDSGGNAYVVGNTSSVNFPTANPFQAASGGSQDAFVLKITNQNGYAISGRVADDTGVGVAAVTVSLSGSQTGVIQTDANGNYGFANLPAGGNYTLTPSKAAFTFVPASRTFNALSADQTANFTVQVFQISGHVTDSAGAALAATTMTLSGTQSATVQTDSLGNYTFPNLAIGNYTVTPSKTDDLLTYTFTPPSRSYTNMSSSQVADFSATTSIQSALYPLADAYVQDGANAGANFGTATPLKVQTGSQVNVGTNLDAYLKYDLSGVGQNISNAKLRISASLSAAGSVSSSVYSVANTTWIESGTGSITWNNRPPRSASPLSGASITLASTTLTSFDIDVTSYVKGEKAAGRDLVSLSLHNPSATTIFINVNSREAAASKPQLIILASATANNPPNVTLSSPANGATFGAPANIALSATATDDGSVSRVDFYSGTSLIGSSNTPSGTTYSATWTGVPAGSYNVYAVAVDNSGFAANSNTSAITVGAANNPPAVTISSPLTGTTFTAGTNIAISATASDIDGTISKVEFFAGANLIGTATVPVNGLYSITWANVNTGAYSLTAKATDNANGLTTSAAVIINVVAQTGLSPTADAYVRDGASATTNFGTTLTLQTQSSTAGNNRETFLKFDLTAVTGITKATVRLYGSLSDATATNVPASIYSVPATGWTESGSGSITWNTKPPSGLLLGNTLIRDNVQRWYEFDVTSYLQGAGGTVVSLVVKNTAQSSPFASFNSREAATNQPQLILWSTQPRNALLVVGSATLNTGDSAARTRLQNLGYLVTVKVAGSNQNSSVKATDADGKALVLISSTVVATNVINKLRNIPVPVINWEFDILDDMGMTGLVSGTDFGTSPTTQTQVNIADPTHPLAAGLSAGPQTVTSPATTFNWGKPNINAAKIAALTTDATKFAIFGYDAGTTMSGLEAPARRVSLFLTDTTAAGLNSSGGALFDAAVKWAAEVITAPTINTLTPASGPEATVVTISGLNFGATQGASTLTFNGLAAVPTTWGDKNIVVAVPAYALTGPVVVTVNGIASNSKIFIVGAVDSDGDGLPDSWELQYFGNLSQGANDDPDNDARTNLQEYQQGRDPTKSALFDDGDFVNLKVYTPLTTP
jgi:hypothetical protein